MTDRYPDSTLDAKFASIEEKLDDHFEATTQILHSVVEQTTKTNGKVQGLQLWRQFILGGMAVFTLFIIPIMGFLAYQIIQSQARIAAIDIEITTLSSHQGI